MRSMQEIITGNKLTGKFFFSKETIKFFDSKVCSPLIDDKYFITSERYDKDFKRLYTVRVVKENYEIGTVGEFQQFKSKKMAMKFIENALKFINSVKD